MLNKFFVLSLLPVFYFIEVLSLRKIGVATLRPLFVFGYFLAIIFSIHERVFSTESTVLIQLVTIGSLLIVGDLKVNYRFYSILYSIWIFILGVSSSVSLVEVYAFMTPLIVSRSNFKDFQNITLSWLGIFYFLISIKMDFAIIPGLEFVDLFYCAYLFFIFKWARVDRVQDVLLHTSFFYLLRVEFGVFSQGIVWLLLLLIFFEVLIQLLSVKFNRHVFYLLLLLLTCQLNELDSVINIFLFTSYFISEFLYLAKLERYNVVNFVKCLSFLIMFYYINNTREEFSLMVVFCVLVYESFASSIVELKTRKTTNIPAS